MPNGHPFFTISSRPAPELQRLLLGGQPVPPFVHYALAQIELTTAGIPSVTRRYSFRLDTGSEITVIPASWFRGERHLLGPISRRVFRSTPPAARAKVRDG
jgi:hypothetical protein